MNVTLESRFPIVVPVLPLDGHVLLPAAATPYRVSDPRHRRLVQDLLDRPPEERWVAVPPRAGVRAADVADDIAALGLLTVATPLEGGEFIVVVEGRGACRLESVTGDTAAHLFAVPYAMARIRHLADKPESLGTARVSTAGLIQALFGLYESFGLAASELPQSDQPLDDAGLVYRIGSAVIEDPAARAHLLSERCPARRREIVQRHIVDQMAFAVREGLLGRQAARC